VKRSLFLALICFQFSTAYASGVIIESATDSPDDSSLIQPAAVDNADSRSAQPSSADPTLLDDLLARMWALFS